MNTINCGLEDFDRKQYYWVLHKMLIDLNEELRRYKDTRGVEHLPGFTYQNAQKVEEFGLRLMLLNQKYPNIRDWL